MPRSDAFGDELIYVLTTMASEDATRKVFPMNPLQQPWIPSFAHVFLMQSRIPVCCEPVPIANLVVNMHSF